MPTPLPPNPHPDATILARAPVGAELAPAARGAPGHVAAVREFMKQMRSQSAAAAKA